MIEPDAPRGQIIRMWRILLALRSRVARNTRDLAELCEVSRRTIFRDLRALSEAGVPVEYSMERQGYRLAPGFAWEVPTGLPLPAGFAMTKRPGRSEYLRGRLRHDAHGPRAERIAREGSGILTSMVAAQGLIELDDARESVHEGDLVPWLGFAALGIPV